MGFCLQDDSSTAPQKGGCLYKRALQVLIYVPTFGVAFASYIYHHFSNQGQPHWILTSVSHIQEEKLYGFHSHQSENSQGTDPPGKALVRLVSFFLSLRK